MLFRSLKGRNWSEPEKMSDNINTPYHETSVSFSPDEKIIYFVSEKPEDNLGGLDIFMSKSGKNGEIGRASCRERV